LGTNSYGFGIASGTLMYSSQSFHKFYNSSNNANTFTIDSTGNISCTGTLTTGSNLTVNWFANIHNGSGAAAVNNFMQSGSLTIGGTNANYGGNFYTGASWTGNNTAGLLLECQDNTEIAVHDSATRLASLVYYELNMKEGQIK
jgi:hypothetical protein